MCAHTVAGLGIATPQKGSRGGQQTSWVKQLEQSCASAYASFVRLRFRHKENYKSF